MLIAPKLKRKISDYEVMLELTRSEANDELTTVMQGYEEDDAAFWDDRYREGKSALPIPTTSSLPPATAKRKSRNRSKSFSLDSATSTPNVGPLKTFLIHPGSVQQVKGRLDQLDTYLATTRKESKP